MRHFDLRVVSIVVVSCGGAAHVDPPVTPTPPVAIAVAARAPVVQVVVDPPEPTWEAHACKRHVWSGDWAEDQPAGDYAGGESDRGHTLDDKIAALSRRPSEGVCDVRLRDRLEVGIIAGSGAGKAIPAKAWDHTSPLDYADQVRAGLSLTADEEARLARDGFVVPARLAYADYTTAYSDIHRGELPVFVSADSILHAIYISHDQLVAKLEREVLVTRLDHALGAMHCALAIAANSYPADVADDVDLYLAVARSLLAGETVPTELGHVEAAAQRMVQQITDAGRVATVSLFGRDRAIDFSAFTPRGHYADDHDLESYFRAATWLSRTEMNLVSRDSRSSQPGYDPDPSETPREAVVALALADLADRAKATPDLHAVEAAWTAFAGRREDVPFAELTKMRAKARIATLTDPDAAAKLRAAIGDGYQRTVNIHPMPNVPRLPAIATMIGPRIVPDSAALYHLIDGRGPELTGPEVGYMLGHDRALAYLGRDPKLRARLDHARTELAAATSGEDLYSAWLDAIRALAKPAAGTVPTFMQSDTFADMRLDSALVAYAQLRHNHVLMAAHIYDQGGCEIPDGYVEPALDTYVALQLYAKRGRNIFTKLDPKGVTKGAAYFTKVERVLDVLAALSREELANRPLSTTARRFLAMIVEDRDSSAWGYMGTFPVAVHDGWYLDLFPFQDAAFKNAAFIADYASYDRNGHSGIHYLGGKGPQLGVFVVDTGGKPRVMVGPVAHGFQHTGPLDKRVDDEGSLAVAGTSPWTASFTLAAPAAPADFAVEFHRPRPKPGVVSTPGLGDDMPRLKMPANLLRIDSARSLGDVTIDVLDHHFVAMTAMTIHVDKGRTEKPIDAGKLPRPIESFRVHAGAFQSRFDLDLRGDERAVFGKDPGD